MSSSRLFKAYQTFLDRHPIKTQAIQTALLMAAGDGISQLVVEKRELKTYDIVRTMKFASFGLFMAGPVLRVWYGVLDRYVKATGAAAALQKVAADQLIFAPSFLVVFISTMGVLNGEGMDQIKERMNRDYWEIITTNWKVWPAIQVFNFYFVPLQYRVLLVQVVAIFWNTYLAFVTNRSK